MVDAGCSLIDYYNGDITRTIPIGGKFSNEQKVIYEIVLSAQKNAIKSEFEIKRMREAIQISAEAHELVRESISSKKNERQIQGLLEGFFLEKGARGPAYNSIVASGDNACILHYTSNNSPLKLSLIHI